MLIFDEAHNIEDVCREAASVELDLETMTDVGRGASRGRQRRTGTWRGFEGAAEVVPGAWKLSIALRQAAGILDCWLAKARLARCRAYKSSLPLSPDLAPLRSCWP